MNRHLILVQIRELLGKILPEGAIVFLFGSQARGDYSMDSDWDLLILLKNKHCIDFQERGSLTLPLYMLGAELGIEINPVLFTDGEWQNRIFTPFFKNVTTDGIKIWGSAWDDAF